MDGTRASPSISLNAIGWWVSLLTIAIRLLVVPRSMPTIVSCCFLFLFGTTQVKGFAVTLVIGLFANVFTAVFVSRTIFNWELGGQKRAVTLSI